ncbi:hypothetical protein K450DRAFT_258013 [Umbelopsis ramanniana AG]|uniref:VASt domain-containing protein n=1 Tax=Umbelopsis ramanniana AG TaxID=1314678 RepID=A0AAD5H9A3_UMBRA|nr:uncharacterized protein K450DRAFT_258013 [Umbelopsis ramanniana AG]KAI8576180.1 hypothetical protein K450DRAFT_258013 [Umbelopsis ramanniana AG]
MANENDGSFLSSVLTAASSTATSLATNLSDRFQESPHGSSGEDHTEKSQSEKPVDAKGGQVAANPAMNLNKQRHGRTHSHTISGDRPPVIITDHRPTASFHRRNSDGGSPGLGASMVADNLLPAAPSTTTATSDTAIFSSTAPSLSLEHLSLKPTSQSETGSVNSAFSDTTATNNDQGTPIADPEQPVTKDMLAVPRRRSRPRGSSVSTTNSLDAKGTSLSRSNSTASRTTALRRKDSDDTDADNASEGGQSATAGSIASACGMELANAKRNSDYHALFRSVPEEDVLVEDYGCALQKEILVQGRMYISENHVCFNANIFGWVTNLVIAFTEIVAIEKRMTAKIIPNAIQISTLHSKHLFASFLSRDQAYDQLIDIWHVAHPTLHNGKLSAKENSVDNDDDNDEDEEDESDYSYEEYSGSDYDSAEYTEVSDDEEEDVAKDGGDTKKLQESARQASVQTLPLPAGKSKEEVESRRRAMSEATSRPNGKVLQKSKLSESPIQQSSPNDSGADKADGTAAQPVKHAPTECACAKDNQHYPSIALDETYTGTLETINNLLFNSGFEKKFLVENQKSTDVNIGPWEKGQGDLKFVRETNYIKYLGGSIGPKTTKCLLKDEVIHYDLDDYITQVTTTQTPDVPSGSSFCVKTRTCLTWAGDNKVRILVTFAVEFSKSSWLKSTIEKASADGQIAYFKALDEAARKYIQQHPNEFHAGGRHPERGERRTKRRRRRRVPKTDKDSATTETKEQEKHGILHKLLSPFLFIGRILWAGIKYIIENAQIPTVQHLTMVFMLLMLIVSLLAVRKMANMERQLAELTHEMQILPASQGLWANEDEREQVWQWLQSKKGDTYQDRSDNALNGETSSQPAGSKASTMVPQLKHELDQEIAHLGMRVQEAQKRLQQLTQEK